MILCKGKGLEPRIEFSNNSIEFEPILPHSIGDEQEVKILNPCPFPIEIYSLEFDKNYLDEEKILRIVRGYDEYNTILLPPRTVGEKLPAEFYEYYEDQLKKLEDEERKQRQSSIMEAPTEIEGKRASKTAVATSFLSSVPKISSFSSSSSFRTCCRTSASTFGGHRNHEIEIGRSRVDQQHDQQ